MIVVMSNGRASAVPLTGNPMGRGQTLNFGLGHLKTFAWLGAFSSASNTKTPAELVAAASASINAGYKLRFFWLSCGDQDGLMNVSMGVHAALETAKIAHVWHLDSGNHTWPVWKNDLYLVSQQLFRPGFAAP